ncbi:MAG: hypothetical protein QM692_21400, partial [Thermomicrobiales bacterium]
PAPPGAHERVRRRVAAPATARRNGYVAGEEAPRLIVLPPVEPTPNGPPSAWTPPALPEAPARAPRWTGWAWLAAVALALVVVGVIAWAQRGVEQPRVIPAAEQATPTPAPSPTPPDAGETLFTLDLPGGALPADSFGVTFDQRTMPPQVTSTEDSEGPLLVRAIVSGAAQAQSGAGLEVWRAGGADGWQAVPADTPVAVAAGDVVLLRGAASLEWANAAEAPVEMIAWQTTDGAGNSEVPDGWTLHDNTATHIVNLEHPEQAAQLTLRRIELAPGDDIAPVAGSWLTQFVALDRNAASELVAPMFGKLPGGVKRNASRQDITVVQFSLAPAVAP